MGEKTKETRQVKLKEHGREHKSKKGGENEGILQGEGNRHGKENFQEREKWKSENESNVAGNIEGSWQGKLKEHGRED